MSLARSGGSCVGAQAVADGMIRSMVLVNAYDATPLTCSFGSLASELLPHARYLHLADDGKWQLLTLEKYMHVRRRGILNVGVLEMFAQCAETLIHDVEHHDTWRIRTQCVSLVPEIMLLRWRCTSVKVPNGGAARLYSCRG